MLESGQKPRVLRFKPDRYAEVRRHAVARDRAHDHAHLKQLLEHRCTIAHLEAHKVPERGNEVDLEPFQPRGDPLHAGLIELETAAHELVVLEGGCSRGERYAIDVERLAHAVHQIGDACGGEGVAHPQSGQTVNLRERARHDEIGIASEPADAVRFRPVFQVFVVGLIQHDHDLGWQRLDECFERGRADQRSRRVVGVGNEHEACVGRHGAPHRTEIMPELARRNLDPACPGRLHRQGVNRERVLRVDRLATGAEKNACGKLKHVIRAVAEDDAGFFHTVVAGQRSLELETVAVGIARELGKDCPDRLLCQGTHAERVLVGSELDDARLLEPQLARELRDRFARLIGRNLTDIAGRQVANVHRCNAEF